MRLKEKTMAHSETEGRGAAKLFRDGRGDLFQEILLASQAYKEDCSYISLRRKYVQRAVMM